MIDVYWLEQTVADLPASDDWLSAGEALKFGGLRFPKRRADWKLGRWTAKRAVAMYLSLPGDAQSLAGLEIGVDPAGAPIVGRAPSLRRTLRPPSCAVPQCDAGTLQGGELRSPGGAESSAQAECLPHSRQRVPPPAISISHRDGRALCAVAAPQTALGCDLEIAEPRSDAFAADYFTTAEQELIAQYSGEDRWRLLALLWSAKESVLKALRVGLRMDTREVSIDPLPLRAADRDWLPLRATHEGRVFHGWWQQTGSVIRTLVADPVPFPPVGPGFGNRPGQARRPVLLSYLRT
ncbi:MAG: 4'-phosphopantetheinyl transferase family protein [Bryobacteraceae bacterium]